MNLQIRDPRAHELAAKLAEERRTSLTEAVIHALENELRRDKSAKPVSERIGELQGRLKTYPRTGEVADKAFFDGLSESPPDVP